MDGWTEVNFDLLADRMTDGQMDRRDLHFYALSVSCVSEKVLEKVTDCVA